jgi:tRNA threonylcarbamoyladenosine biosynthesis protein TsaB
MRGIRKGIGRRVIILALDTTLNRCSVALVEDARALASLSESMHRGHAERLAPMVDEVMRAGGGAFKALDRIVVTTGPGSFTGLRVGLAFARGLAVALSKPCIGISSLEALALEAGEEGLRGAVIAGGGELYVALYENGAARISPRRMSEDEARAALAGALVRGPAAGAFGGEIVDAPDAIKLALRGAQRDPADYPPNPLYLRDADAKLPAQ